MRSALARFGLTVQVFHDAVEAGYLARISRTDNDAPNAAGTYQWNETLRMLREHLAVRGWERSNEGGFPTVIRPQRDVAFCVSSGDQNTGIAARTPSTKNHKGPCTAERVGSNAQLFLFPDMESTVQFDDNPIATWFLLFYTDEREIRSELSLPIFMDSGQISDWRERIILPAIPRDEGGDGITRPVKPDFGPDVDIEIRRKA